MSNLQIALAYAQKGLFVTPLDDSGKAIAEPTRSPEAITGHWSAVPDAPIGIQQPGVGALLFDSDVNSRAMPRVGLSIPQTKAWQRGLGKGFLFHSIARTFTVPELGMTVLGTGEVIPAPRSPRAWLNTLAIAECPAWIYEIHAHSPEERRSFLEALRARGAEIVDPEPTQEPPDESDDLPSPGKLLASVQNDIAKACSVGPDCALGTAIALVGTLFGRHLDVMGVRGNVWTVALSDSPQEQVCAWLWATVDKLGISRRIAQNHYRSAKDVVRDLGRNGSNQLQVTRSLHDYWRRNRFKQGDLFEVMMAFHDSAHAVYHGAAHGIQIPLHNPCWTWLAMEKPHRFAEIKDEMRERGLTTRLLVCQDDEAPPMTPLGRPPGRPAEAILGDLKERMIAFLRMHGQKNHQIDHRLMQAPITTKVNLTDGAKAELKRFQDWCAVQPDRELWGRAFGNAQRLAAIRAAADWDAHAKTISLTKPGATWCIRMAARSAARLGGGRFKLATG